MAVAIPPLIDLSVGEGSTVLTLPHTDGKQPVMIVLKDAEAVKRKRDNIISEGAEHLHVISDFDFTLSQFWHGGRRGCTCHGVLDSSNLLTEEYHRISSALFHKYYPLEVDATISHEDRVRYAREWVETCHEAMLSAGITRQIIEKAVTAAHICLRSGHSEFFEILKRRSIPLLIFSGGIADVVEEVLKQHFQGDLPDIFHIISNKMVFDEDDRMIGFTGPALHVFNKNAGAVLTEPYFQSAEVQTRKNVLLLGDSLGDVHMVDGLETRTVLSIGFLNDKVQERLASYLSAYDVVIIGQDAGFEYVLDVLDGI